MCMRLKRGVSSLCCKAREPALGLGYLLVKR